MSRSSAKLSTTQLVLCAVMVALTAICAWISIPIGSVPVTLQVMAVLLCASMLRPLPATLTLTAYALLGLVGAPVFSGMTGGAAKLFGLTGGYIIGFIPCAFLTSLLIHNWGRELWKQLIAMVLGVVICYVFGTVWFMVLDVGNQARPLATVIGLCVLPFLPFDAIKIAIAAFLSQRLYQPMKRILPDC